MHLYDDIYLYFDRFMDNTQIWPIISKHCVIRSKDSFSLSLRHFLHHFQQMLDGSLWVKTFGTGDSAHTNVLTFLESHVLWQLFDSFTSVLITWVHNPSVSLHQDWGTKIGIRMPPVARTGGRAACTKHTFIESIKFLSIIDTLIIFFILCKNMCTFGPLTSFLLR